MQSNHLFRVSLSASVFLVTLGLWMGEENPLPYPWLMLFCLVGSYAFTDQWSMLAFRPSVAPWFGAAAIAWFVREELASYRIDPVLPLGHLFLWLLMILLFHKKTVRIYWYILFMSFLLMLIAALHNNTLTFGILMGAYLTLIIWTLSQFTLVRTADQFRGVAVGRQTKTELQPIVAGLFATLDQRLASHAPAWSLRPIVAGSVASSAIIFAVALLLFLVIPRRGQTAWSQAANRPGQYLTGFDERIRLGQLGTILESDEEVMVVRMFDEKGQPYRPVDEPYWRGVALVHYQDGRWERRVDAEPKESPWGDPPERFIRQDIRLQAVHRDVLFCLRPAFRGQTQSGEPLTLDRLDGTVERSGDVPTGPLQYTVESHVDASLSQPSELSARRMLRDQHFRSSLTQVPANLRTPLRDYVARLNIASADDPMTLIAGLMAHLQDPAIFDYTLRAAVADPDIDPVLDFLVNRKEGHCEYFASALALMLRAHDVPARVVNGFKGGDLNDILGPSIVVRQKHAHSWVEAIVRPADQPARWITLDPTPGQSRQRQVALVDRTPPLIRQVRDVSRQVWSYYVLNFNSTEQETAIYGPVRQYVTHQLQQLATAAKSVWTNPPRGFNWIAAALASAITTLLIVLFKLLSRLLSSATFAWDENGAGDSSGFFARFLRAIRNLLARWSLIKSPARQRIAFYDQLLLALESHGLDKSPTSTPRQFAEHAGQQLQRWPAGIAVAHIPDSLVDRYYQVRFGHHNLTPSQSQEIDRQLDELTAAIFRKE